MRFLESVVGIGLCVGCACLAIAQSEVVPSSPAVAVVANQAGAYHSGWGSLQPDGSLTGRVVTVGNAGVLTPQAGATVTLMQDQTVIATTQANADGVFEVRGLSASVYELTAESSGSFAALSFQAVPTSNTDRKVVMDVYACDMPRNKVEQIFQELWAPQQSTFGTMPLFEALIAPLMPAAQSQRVTMTGGVVRGQVAFSNALNIPQAHVVKIFRAGRLVATVPVDAMGRFSFSPGGLGPVNVILGGSAYGSISAEIVDGSAAEFQLSHRGSDGGKLVSTANNLLASSTLLIPAAGGPASPSAPVQEEVVVLPPPPLAGGFMPTGGGYMGGGGGGFGGGGSGGGGGGFGGAGGLLGAAGLAIGVVALSDNNNRGNFNVVPATPLGP